MSGDRVGLIRARLETRLAPTHCEVLDESHLHRGHQGAADGRGHFRVRISSPQFSGKKTLEIHRLIYEALGEMMTTDIHALAIEVVR